MTDIDHSSSLRVKQSNLSKKALFKLLFESMFHTLLLHFQKGFRMQPKTRIFFFAAFISDNRALSSPTRFRVNDSRGRFPALPLYFKKPPARPAWN